MAPRFADSLTIEFVEIGVTVREVFKSAPEVKNKLWGGEFWTKGYFINTVSQHANENVMKNYVKNQGLD